MYRFCRWSFVATLLGLAGADAARADQIFETITATFASQGPSLPAKNPDPLVSVYNGSTKVASLNLSQGGAMDWTNLTRTSGPDNFTFAGNPTAPVAGGFLSFCAELTQGISYGKNYSYNIESLSSAPTPASGALGNGMGTLAANLISELWYSHFNAIFDPHNNANTEAAALQLAMWKVEYDPTSFLSKTGKVNWTSGNLRVDNNLTAAAVVLAASFLQDPTFMHDGSGPKAELYAMVSSTAQDQIVQAVPEPSSVVLTLSALAALVVGRTRRRTASTAAIAATMSRPEHHSLSPA
jgi:hypothetical protein